MPKDTANTAAWFAGFRQHTEDGQADVVFLQETRATKEWSEILEKQYVQKWGIRPEQVENPISFWPSPPSSAGGVAMLFRPGAAVTNPRPIWVEHWSPWFMAVEADVDGTRVTLVNVYGPSGSRKARERLFLELKACPKPKGLLILGGDFNCTLDTKMDRSHPAQQSHDSPALHELLEHWDVADAVWSGTTEHETEASKRDFYVDQHTYRYRLPTGGLATSRLDRWYISSKFCTSRQDHQSTIATTTPCA